MEYGAVYTSVYTRKKSCIVHSLAGYKGSFVLFIFIYVYGIYQNKLQPTNNVVSISVLADMFCVMCRHPPPSTTEERVKSRPAGIFPDAEQFISDQFWMLLAEFCVNYKWV